ncbi:MAG TPA: hypothetical protein VJ023_13155, partial [Pyrinomonadaceae bacterium]|nr:hypothetical protein [Pyrinomonadaceae bacterium]
MSDGKVPVEESRFVTKSMTRVRLSELKFCSVVIAKGPGTNVAQLYAIARSEFSSVRRIGGEVLSTTENVIVIDAPG